MAVTHPSFLRNSHFSTTTWCNKDRSNITTWSKACLWGLPYDWKPPYFWEPSFSPPKYCCFCVAGVSVFAFASLACSLHVGTLVLPSVFWAIVFSSLRQFSLVSFWVLFTACFHVVSRTCKLDHRCRPWGVCEPLPCFLAVQLSPTSDLRILLWSAWHFHWIQ